MLHITFYWLTHAERELLSQNYLCCMCLCLLLLLQFYFTPVWILSCGGVVTIVESRFNMENEQGMLSFIIEILTSLMIFGEFFLLIFILSLKILIHSDVTSLKIL